MNFTEIKISKKRIFILSRTGVFLVMSSSSIFFNKPIASLHEFLKGGCEGEGVSVSDERDVHSQSTWSTLVPVMTHVFRFATKFTILSRKISRLIVRLYRDISSKLTIFLAVFATKSTLIRNDRAFMKKVAGNRLTLQSPPRIHSLHVSCCKESRESKGKNIIN